ncbi:MBL fold metallo-hydrolase [Marinovum sp. 2_MG-2023]|uniref:MBL fold metallo-hydrolase n=1 Tax=unclassified Marinovum TaxID=2647166 RepID=UPI0026E324A3|nr:MULTISPECIES: MBL fold metallo-hydrolase [unclassified Marinovum]MDO6732589.1 MBL fold metallo-hydrolase [Marinovum sp. 2_MG-2023]MDO6782044.1 MBL fold metallo-hydrolase [Marinovum sp. 1_MG-2023]
MPCNTRKVGNWTISRIDEVALALPTTVLFPDWDDAILSPETRTCMQAGLAANGADLVVPVHSWLIRNDALTILVDTGVGNGRARAFDGFNNLNTDYLPRLSAAGVDPDDVDFVLCTHIHTDHVGWNTTWDGNQWTPTFPNARYVWGQVEGAVARRPFFHEGPAAGLYEDSILPIITAGQAEEIAPGAYDPIDGLTFHSTPGHSPGHMSISIKTDTDMLMFGGDVLHNQAQVFHPEWNSVFCEDPETARRSRLWALEFCADTNALFFGTHLGGSAVGRIKRVNDRFTWTHE